MTKSQTEVINAVVASINAAISPDPTRDWRDSLADAADALEGIIKQPSKRTRR